MLFKKPLSLKLMTYNVGKLKDDPNRSGAILDVIQHFKPDVLALQELTITKYRMDFFSHLLLN
jgi:mRNA deadenylase 3'-5' endonuclease subunit Ccr4